MEDDDKKPEDPYQGVKIQKLPTMGKPLSYRTWKQGYRTGREITLAKARARKIEKIVKVLSEK